MPRQRAGPSYNLDSWAMSPSEIGALAAETAAGADLVIAEASMGLFDGVPAQAGRTRRLGRYCGRERLAGPARP